MVRLRQTIYDGLPSDAEDDLYAVADGIYDRLIAKGSTWMLGWDAGFEAGLRAVTPTPPATTHQHVGPRGTVTCDAVHEVTTDIVPRAQSPDALRGALEDVRSFVAEMNAKEGAGYHYAISQLQVLDYIDLQLRALADSLRRNDP